MPTSVEDIIERLTPIPKVDHAAFGEVEVRQLSRIQRVTGAFLGQNCLRSPDRLTACTP